MTIKVTLTVNGKRVSAEIEGRTLLVQLLREHLRLTGTHVGCDTTQCLPRLCPDAAGSPTHLFTEMHFYCATPNSKLY